MKKVTHASGTNVAKSPVVSRKTLQKKAQSGTKEKEKNHVEKSLKAVFDNFNQF